jgi:hypothetical protein
MPLPLAYDDAVLGFAGARRRSKDSFGKWDGPLPPPSFWLKPEESFSVESGLPSILRFRLKVGSRKMTLYEYFNTHLESSIPTFLHKEIRKVMSSLGFRPLTIRHFLRCDGITLKRIDSLWLAIQDNLIGGLPELFVYQPEEVLRIYVWITSNAVYGVDHAGKLFKTLAKWLVVKGAKGEVDIPLPDPPVGTIWFGPKGFSCKIGFVRNLVEFGIRSKDEASRLAMLSSTRGLPCGSKDQQLESARKHQKALSTLIPMDEDRLRKLRHIAQMIGRKVKRSSYKGFALEDDPGHLSVTSSASLGSSRSDGGKANEVRTELRSWINQVPEIDREYFVASGHMVTEKAGIPRYHTIRIPGIAEPEDEPADAGWLEPYRARSTPFPVFVGLNKHTGLMIMACATEAAQRRGVLDENLRLTHKNYPIAEVAVVSEPGFKSRIVTKTEWWLTTLLQPYAHWMLSEMKAFPSARHGLGGAHQGFEWAKDSSWKEWNSSYDDFLLLSSDLSQATDHCSHEVGYQLMTGLLDGLGLSNDYFNLCVELQTCNRRIISPIINESYDCVTGILMGDPGTKVVLTMFNLAAEQEAALTFFEGHIPPDVHWRNFACAGDDHIAFGPREYLKAISQAHRDNHMVVSEDQNFRSDRLSRYCEQFIYMDGTVKPYQGRNLNRAPYEENCFVDALKIRLLSREVKGQEARDEKNPAIGKGSALSSYIEWSAPGFRNHMVLGVSRYFHSRMYSLLEGVHLLRLMPCQLGGLGHCPDFRSEDWAWMVSNLSKEHINAICYIKSKGDRCTEVLRCLRIPSSRGFRRGLASTDEDDLVCLFLLGGATTGTVARDADDVLKDIGWSEEQLSRTRMAYKLKLLSQRGFYSEQYIVSKFRRTSTFKKLLTSGEKPKDFRTVSFDTKYKRMQEALASLELPEGDPFEAITFLEEFGTDRRISFYLERARVIHLDELDRSFAFLSQKGSYYSLEEFLIRDCKAPEIIPDGDGPGRKLNVRGFLPPKEGEDSHTRPNFLIAKGELAVWYEEWLLALERETAETGAREILPVTSAIALEPDLCVPLSNWVIRS